MVILTLAIQSTGAGGSGTVEFLRIPPLVQKLLSFEVEPGFAQPFAHWKFVCCRRTQFGWMQKFPKKPILSPNEWGKGPVDHPSHVYTPKDSLWSIPYSKVPSGSKDRKTQKNSGTCKIFKS